MCIHKLNAPDNVTINVEDVRWSCGNGTPSNVEQIEELAADFSKENDFDEVRITNGGLD